uniref:MADF domain-containing protein n=1 Tax=Clastoptera arizonana TaxID=38151 RepID=A0A1B6DXI5_9HEMI
MAIRTPNVQKVRFSTDEDDFLIEFVHTHTILYDLKHEEFKNRIKKELIWSDAGKILNREGSECKKRWKSIRDHYRREKKEEKGSAGSAKKKRAVYWDRLRFLDGVEEGESFMNDPSAPDNQITAAEDDFADEENYENGMCEYTYEDQSMEEPENRELNKTAFLASKLKRRKENYTINNYLKNKKDYMKNFKKCLQELVKPISQETENEHDLFFKSVAGTVKKLRPDLIVRTKAKIFQIVSEMELLNQQSSSTADTAQASTASSSWTTPKLQSEDSKTSDHVSKEP